MPCEALLKLVMAVLDYKNPDEVAMVGSHGTYQVTSCKWMHSRNGGFTAKPLTIFLQLVEFTLRKVIEEFGQQAQCEDGNVSIITSW